MSKVTWKPGTFINPVPAVMVSCGTMEKSNIVTVAWTGTINSDPAMCYISLRSSRYSYKIIKESGEFVINLTTSRLTKATDWCGCRSGEKFDKFKEMNLTKEKANFVKCPMIKESPVSIECKVKEIKELGTHHMFIAEVLAINVNEDFIDRNGAFDIQKCDLISYANGGYYAQGRKIGKFGFSVMKNKNIKKGKVKNNIKISSKNKGQNNKKNTANNKGKYKKQNKKENKKENKKTKKTKNKL